MSLEVWAVDGGYFYAGVVLENGKVVETAPIARRCLMGKTREQAEQVCRQKRWKIVRIMK